jgi:hypothetical protein
MNDSAGVLSLLSARGAADIEHPGGTLLSHLVRVSHQLARLSTAPAALHVQLAGLAHDCYGTEGFPLALISPDDGREQLRSLIGPEAEELVHLYAGCDRGRTWRPLASTRQVWSRFGTPPQTLTDGQLQAFADLCTVNEVDVLAHTAQVPERHREAFASLFDSWRPIASPAVMTAADDALHRLATANATFEASSTAL